MPGTKIQNSFSSGEVSPSLYSRTDIDRYASALRTCRNFIPQPEGGVKNRPGTVFIATTKYSTTRRSRVIRFLFSQTQAYVFEIGHEYIRFYTDQAQIQISSSVSADQTSSGMTVYSDSDSVGEGRTRAIDNSASTFWGSGTGAFPHWIAIDLGSGNGKIINEYTITARNDGGYPESPYDFLLQGSNDTTNGSDGTWTTLDTRTSIAFAQSEVKTFVNFSAGTNTTSYRFYRIYCTDNQPAASNTKISIAEITLHVVTSTEADGEAYEISTPYTEDDIDQLRFESSADVTYITHPDFPPYTLTRFSNISWALEEYSSDNGPFMPQNITSTTLTASATSGSITLTASAAVFSALHVGALFRLKHYIEGQFVSNSFSGTGTSSSIKCFTTWRVISHGTWTGKFKVEKSDDGGSTWTNLRKFSSADDFNANTFGTEDIETNLVPFLVRINMDTYTSGTATIDLSTDPFFQEGIARVTAFSSSTSVTATVLATIGTTTATDAWSEGSWSDYRGYPAVCRFFQDRLAFAATYSEPQTTWLTEIGNYISFFTHSTLLATDGISANLPSRQLNAINGLIAVRKLIALTSASEWTIGAVSGSALSPTTTEQLPQGYRGSSGIDPVIVGNEVIFVQSNSKVVRNLSYQFGSDGYDGSNLNVLAKHLFKQWDIDEIAYQQDPDSVVWAIRSDGILLGMTYLQEQEVLGWSWHDTGGNDSVSGGDNQTDSFESICVIPGAGYDEVYFVVNRINGRFIERMSERFTSTACDGYQEVQLKKQIFLDSVVSTYDPIDITEVYFLSNNILIYAPAHGLANDTHIQVNGIEGLSPTATNNIYKVKESTTNTFKLATV